LARQTVRFDRPLRTPPNHEAAAALLFLLDRHAPGVTPHMDRTAELAHAVAARLEVGTYMLQATVRAAHLHDVGKLGVPARLLHKPGPLSETEWSMIRQHPVLGEMLLARTPGLASIAPLVRSTHERYDGRGYPDRLADEEIPLPSRIVAACAAFDAMLEPRSHRPPLARGDAVEALRRGAGSEFDPLVVVSVLDEVDSSGNRRRIDCYLKEV
jgi:HD-GYP domain-containing protein (c-di-GMP phosphodiesterase class II)